MAVINLFIAFFVIVALAISWLVFNLVFGTRPQMTMTGDGEIPTITPTTLPEKPMDVVPAVTKIDSVAVAEPPSKKKTVKTTSIKKSSDPKRKPGRPKKQSGPTCVDEMIAAAKALTEEKGADEFAAKEIVDYLIEHGTSYSVGTIRSQLVSRATDAGSTNGDGPKDFERVKRGVYRLTL